MRAFTVLASKPAMSPPDDLEFHGQLSLRRCNVDGSGGGILTRKSITAEPLLDLAYRVPAGA